MATDKLERIYTVNLSGAYGYPRTKRAIKAVEILRAFIARHMKARDGKVTISNAVNALVWGRSIQKPPRRVKVRAVKEGSDVKVSLVDEKQAKVKFATKKRATAEERKPKAAPKKAAEAKPDTAKKEDKPAEKKDAKAQPAKAEPKAADAAAKKAPAKK
ncbi:MAG: 50S ribosomal protein L31e [Candidatus Micrarchaeia archaeon]